MNATRTEIRAKPLILVSALLFAAFISNVLLGMMALQHGADVPYLSDVWEFLLLFAGASSGVVFILLNEQPAD